MMAQTCQATVQQPCTPHDPVEAVCGATCVCAKGVRHAVSSVRATDCVLAEEPAIPGLMQPSRSRGWMKEVNCNWTGSGTANALVQCTSSIRQ